MPVGNDSLVGGSGNDTYDGGAGWDMVFLWDAPAGVIADLGTGEVSGEGTDRLEDVEAIVGTPFDDTLTGGNGNDAFVPMGGDDAVDGAAGSDIVGFYPAPGPVTVDLAAGTATGDGSDQLAGIEHDARQRCGARRQVLGLRGGYETVDERASVRCNGIGHLRFPLSVVGGWLWLLPWRRRAVVLRDVTQPDDAGRPDMKPALGFLMSAPAPGACTGPAPAVRR